jgi:hypothetical protein
VRIGAVAPEEEEEEEEVPIPHLGKQCFSS